MKHYTLTDTRTGKTYERINKQRARKIYETATPENGNCVIMCGCNLNPFTPWGGGARWTYDRYEGVSFNQACDETAYYNCDNERGRYLAFYTEVKA